MKNNLIYIAVFAVGAVVGSAATMQYAKRKYQKYADEQIESVKEVFSKLDENAKKEEAEEIDGEERDRQYTQKYMDLMAKRAEKAQAMENYRAVLNNLNYGVKGVKPVDGPYVISPTEFGEIEDYDTVSLRYYADGYLTDDQDILVDDIESLVSCEALRHFGEYEEDSVFVRNDDMGCDFEILKDVRNYKDILISKQHRQDN